MLLEIVLVNVFTDGELVMVITECLLFVERKMHNICAGCIRMKADGTDRKVVISTAIDKPTALAYDWVHGILYWADKGPPHGSAKIEAVVLKTGHRHVLFTAPAVDNPRTMVVDPRTEQG